MKDKKRYSITYVSGATGYGWEHETNSMREVKQIIKSMFNYTSALDVYDREADKFIYWKRVLSYDPEINEI